MRKRKTTTKSQKRKRQQSRAVRERDSIPWKYCFLTLVCGAFLVVGFFGAARQHFASIDYGIKNSKLKKQIKELESEKQNLILAREVAYSPEKIKKAARKIGMVETSSRIQPTFSAVKISSDETDKTEADELKDESKKKSDEKEKVEKPKPKSKDKEKSEPTAKSPKKKNTDKKSKANDSDKLKPKVQKAKESTVTRERKVNAKK